MMKQKIKDHPRAALFVGLYIVGILVLLLWHLVLFFVNKSLYANGTFVPGDLAIEDFEFYDIIEEDDGLLSVGPDPQLLLKDQERKIDTVTLELEYSKDPYLVNVFYAPPGQDYSLRRMLYPVNEGTSQRFLMPPTGGQSLRIDPGTVGINHITIHRIQVNQPRSFAEFFRVSTSEWMLLLFFPGFAACCIAVFLEGKKMLANRSRQQEKPDENGSTP